MSIVAFFRARSANIAITVALSLIPLIGLFGLGIDSTLLLRQRSLAQQAANAAAIAAAKYVQEQSQDSNADQTAIAQEAAAIASNIFEINAVLSSNNPTGGCQDQTQGSSVSLANREFMFGRDCTYQTLFMRIFGIDSIDYMIRASAKFVGFDSIDIIFVLDLSSSMCDHTRFTSNNYCNSGTIAESEVAVPGSADDAGTITSLKSAFGAILDTIEPANPNTDSLADTLDIQRLRIGLVPYHTAVDLGDAIAPGIYGQTQVQDHILIVRNNFFDLHCRDNDGGDLVLGDTIYCGPNGENTYTCQYRNMVAPEINEYFIDDNNDDINNDKFHFTYHRIKCDRHTRFFSVLPVCSSPAEHNARIGGITGPGINPDNTDPTVRQELERANCVQWIWSDTLTVDLRPTDHLFYTKNNSPVLPLTEVGEADSLNTNMATLQASIDQLDPPYLGFTNGLTGLYVAQEILNGNWDAAFTTDQQSTNTIGRNLQAIVLMSDGRFDIPPYDPLSNYSNSVDVQPPSIDGKVKEICDNLKNSDVIIISIYTQPPWDTSTTPHALLDYCSNENNYVQSTSATFIDDFSNIFDRLKPFLDLS